MSSRHRIAVAMSGGVDSSMAAALLAGAGEDIFGLMLRLWSEGPDGTNRCCSPADIENARRVSAQLDIPFYVLDVRDRFKAQVVDFFVGGYAQGLTPNPCMECNRHIRWGFLLQKALAMGASHLATGHYARVTSMDGAYRLLRAADRTKDQSYVLSVMGQAELARAVFPLGELTKAQVREQAAHFGLPVADRKESQDLCFIGRGDYRELLAQQSAMLPPAGDIVDVAGARIGQHTGLADYTIGQRKGLGVSSPQPLYVLEKRVEGNVLVVGPREALGRASFIVARVNWISGEPPSGPLTVDFRIRYRSREVEAHVIPQAVGDAAEVVLSEPLPDVTPGQAAVFYQGQLCLGGGIIQP